MTNNYLFPIIALMLTFQVKAQHGQDAHYQLLEDTLKPYKIIHAEPLYIDLIRDLGARKGEKEWNIGFGLTDELDYDRYEALVEYEWAVADRLGLEVEVPFTMYSLNQYDADKPSARIESLKTAIQWSFMVNPKTRTSAALGYINEIELYDLNMLNSQQIVHANVFNPFLVVAQRIGRNWHSILYTGPSWTYEYNHKKTVSQYEAHLSFHYMIPGSRNFFGVETNTYTSNGDFMATLRPQMRLEITHNIMAGIVTSIPVTDMDERMGFFIRLIYEP